MATFYTGCTPGREDYPTFTKYVSQLHAMTTNGDLPGNVAFVASLKNGVNAGVAGAWARIDGSDVSVSGAGSNGGFPLLVDDRHRALVYKLFDAALHPAYAVIDHCMRYAALLPSVDVQTADNALVTVGPDKTSSSQLRHSGQTPRVWCVKSAAAYPAALNGALHGIQ